MRIIAGHFKGLRLSGVGKGDVSAHLRPTSDRVRENLFNVLSGGNFGDPVTGAVVLDLFAGTGALGLEALSRGAREATFVDDGRVAADLIRKNIALTGTASTTRLVRRSATQLGPCEGSPASLVFMDPPYGKSLGQRALRTAVNGGWLSENALVVWEEASPMEPPDGFAKHATRRYGDTHITFLEVAPQTRPD